MASSSSRPPSPQPASAASQSCGLCCWRPRWLQRLATIRTFILVVSIFSCLCSGLNSGYAVSMISTIEKRFGIGSTLAGFMTSCYEIGYIPAVVIVSYLGGSRCKPRWLASGAVVMALAAFIFTLPQFISAPYSASLMKGGGGADAALCQAPLPAAPNRSQGITGFVEDPCEGLRGGFGGQSNTWNIFLLVVANVLLGCGASPILTLGTTYIDDHTSPEQAPPLIATIYAASAVGPMLGHLLGAMMLQFYVDQVSLDPKKLQLKPGDPEWVGAWWAGFFLLGLSLAVCSVPLFMFPARLPGREKRQELLEAPKEDVAEVGEEIGKEEVKEEVETPLEIERRPSLESADRNYGRRWQDLPRATFLLIRNRVYLVTCTGICFEMAVINAFAVFLPKYIETQFSVPNFTASVLTGACAVPVGALGILAGGLLCRKLGLTRRGAVRLVLLANIGVLVLYVLSFIIGCENAPIAGITAPYSPNASLRAPIPQDDCNLGCGGCSLVAPAPVCSPDLGLTYLSACHAGCRSSNSSAAFTNCSCLVKAGLSSDALVLRGSCPQRLTEGSCASHRLVPFLAFLCLTIFLTAVTQNPLLMVTMRSVRPAERAFGLGFQFVILRLFGYIPAPITFGRVIDSTCLHWTKAKGCPASLAGSSSVAAAAASAAAIDGTGAYSAKTATGRISGSCLFYDLVLFRNKTFGLAMGLKFASLIVYIILLSLLKRDCLGGDQADCQRGTEDDDTQRSVRGAEGVRLSELEEGVEVKSKV